MLQDEKRKKKDEEDQKKQRERAKKMAEFEKWKNPTGPNFVISRKSEGDAGAVRYFQIFENKWTPTYVCHAHIILWYMIMWYNMWQIMSSA